MCWTNRGVTNGKIQAERCNTASLTVKISLGDRKVSALEQSHWRILSENGHVVLGTTTYDGPI